MRFIYLILKLFVVTFLTFHIWCISLYLLFTLHLTLVNTKHTTAKIQPVHTRTHQCARIHAHRTDPVTLPSQNSITYLQPLKITAKWWTMNVNIWTGHEKWEVLQLKTSEHVKCCNINLHIHVKDLTHSNSRQCLHNKEDRQLVTETKIFKHLLPL